MTTPRLYKPRAPLRPPTVPPASLPQLGLDDVRVAAIRDILQPYLFDDTGLRTLVCDELRAAPAGPRIIEFGCGTGRLTAAMLATRRDAVYHGFERSEPDVAVAICKLSRQGLHGGATFTAPFDLDASEIREALQGLRADFVVLPRFLQTVPLCATDTALHRVAFLALCRQLVKPGGRILIIEDVYGEDADEQTQFSVAWRTTFRARLTRDLDAVHSALQRLDPNLAGRLGRLPGDPWLVAVLRDCIQKPGAQILPLSTWQRTFEQLGLTYDVVRHPTQPQLCFFTIRC